ncbi:MAG: methionyl-tRNA formyltransferase [Actinomycetota bacterium]|nr:methionyl-tRNA formyltransferase [Actinomycetota bacterium]
MRIVFAGTPQAAVPSLQALIQTHRSGAHQIVAVVTRPDSRVGRGRTLRASPVAEVAQQAGLTVIKAAGARDPEFADGLRALRPDVGAVVAYGAILPQPVLDIPVNGWVNLHFSLLPAWRGAAPVAAAIRNGDQLTGASTFRLEAGLDTGPVYGVVTEPIGPRDTAGDLLGRLASSGAALLGRTLDGIADESLEPQPQPVEGASHVGKVTIQDALIDWTAPAVVVDRQIRAMTPEPGAWTESRWGKMGLGPVEPGDGSGLAPGELLVSKREVCAGTGSTAVRLGLVMVPGKRPTPAADWARGARPDKGELLGGGETVSAATPPA